MCLILIVTTTSGILTTMFVQTCSSILKRSRQQVTPRQTLYTRYTNQRLYTSTTTLSQTTTTTPPPTDSPNTTTIPEEKDGVVRSARRDQISTVRNLRDATDKIHWPASNLKEEMDDTPESYTPYFQYNKGDSVGNLNTKEEEAFQGNQMEQREERFSEWADDVPAANRKTAKSFGVRIHDKISERDAVTLSMFVNELGRIKPRHLTGLTAKQQRKLARTIKKARHMGILPHTFRLPPDYAYMSPAQSTIPAKIMDEEFGAYIPPKKKYTGVIAPLKVEEDSDDEDSDDDDDLDLDFDSDSDEDEEENDKEKE